MDIFRDDISFALCSLGTAYCIYNLLKISLDNYKSRNNESVTNLSDLKIMKNNPLKTKNSGNGSTTPKLILSRKHFYQKKLDKYINEMSTKATNFNDKKKTDSYVYKICLTGGPNAGKTTAKTHIREMLRDRGFKVYTVPLVTTITNESGGMMILSNLDPNGFLKFQAFLVKLQMNLEDYFTSLAYLGNEKTVIICDRGVMDLQFFGPPENWEEILAENDWTAANLRDRRYDAVIHLVTSAEGAPDYYKSRHSGITGEIELEKSLANARKIDENLKNAWMGHPNYTIIDNSSADFLSKINMAFSCVCKFVGLPVLNNYVRKFLLEKYLIPPNVKFEEFQVTEIFLNSKPNIEFKIRKRAQNGIFTYLSEITEKKEDGYRLETKKILTAREFSIMLLQKDEACIPLEKERKSFIWNQQLYVIDSIKLPNDRVIEILRFDTQAKNEHFVIPPFCKITKEVTDDMSYNSFELAKIRERN